MYSTQEEVFESVVRPIVQEALEGFNCTIFAYGQTGTGKTHTMEGDIHSEENAGIVPRSVKAILEQLEASGSEFTIRVSFLELYNEELQDLLVPGSSDKKLKLCEDVKKGVVCQNLEEITVLNVNDIFEILQRGIQQRQTAATLCNKNSSRSHSIFTLKIMIKETSVDGEEVVRNGQLNLVDLAGSECVGRSGAKNDRAREAGSINQSLLTLGRVITALVEHHGHIPYRDSKLTRILQESLGGKAKTCIIATLSPSQGAVEETLSTLDYANRAKNIKNQPTVNQRLTKKVVLKEYCAEIEELRQQLQITREKNGIFVDPKKFYAMETQLSTQENMIAECESALRARNDELKKYKAEKEEFHGKLESLQNVVDSTKAELGVVNQTLVETKSCLEDVKIELKASDAVIDEQVETEDKLLQQGSQLQNEVTSRRDDVDKLLSKIDRIAANEQVRSAETQKFISAVADENKNLVDGIETIIAVSNDQSKSLCSGVAVMLEKGRDTCATLTSSINTALSTLIDDAKAANGKMTGSCSGLETHLNVTNDNLRDTLINLQLQLSSWIGEVDSSMKQVQEHLDNQQKQYEELSSKVASQLDASGEVTANFTKLHKDLSAESAEKLVALKMETKECMKSFEEESKERTEIASKELNEQAAALQETMATMMQQMLQKSLSVLVANSTATTKFCQSIEAVSENGFSGLETVHNEISTKTIETITDLQNKADTFASTANASIDGLHENKNAIESMVSVINNTVGDKRKILDDTVNTLVDKVNTAILDGCAVVHDISNVASSTLKDVVAATETMNSSSSQAVESFVTFMDNEGENVCSKLGECFSKLQNDLSNERSRVNDIDNTIKNYTESMDGMTLKPTGQTPKKQAFSDKVLNKLSSTRSHDIIRTEVKNKSPESEPVEIDEVAVAVEVVEAPQISEEKELEENVVNENSNPQLQVSTKGSSKLAKSKLTKSKSVTLDSKEAEDVRTRSASTAV